MGDVTMREVEYHLAHSDPSAIREVVRRYLRPGRELDPAEIRKLILWHRCLLDASDERAEAICDCLFDCLRAVLCELDDLGSCEGLPGSSCRRLFNHLVRGEVERIMTSHRSNSQPGYWVRLVEQIAARENLEPRIWFRMCVDVHLHLSRISAWAEAESVREVLRRMSDSLDDQVYSSLELRAEADYLSRLCRNGDVWGDREEGCLDRILQRSQIDCAEDVVSRHLALSSKVVVCINTGDYDGATAVWSEQIELEQLSTMNEKAMRCFLRAAVNMARLYSDLDLWESCLGVFRVARRVNLRYDYHDKPGARYVEVLGEVWEFALRTGRQIRLDNEIYEAVKDGSLGSQTKERFLEVMKNVTACRASDD